MAKKKATSNKKSAVKKKKNTDGISPKVLKKLKNISEYSGEKLSEIKKLYLAKLSKERKDNTNDWGEEILIKKSITKVKNKFKREKMTTLYLARGIFFSIGRIRDMNNKVRLKALEEFEDTNDIKYILTKKIVDPDDGSTSNEPVLDEDGGLIPIDWRKEIDKKDGTSFKNKRYNSKIEPNHVQNCFGFFELFDKKGVSQGIKYTVVAMRGDKCSYDIPKDVPVEFKAILSVMDPVRDKDKNPIGFTNEDIFVMKSTSTTDIKEIEMDLPRIDHMVSSMSNNDDYKFKTSTISEVFEVNEMNKEVFGDWNGILVIEKGSVLQIFPPNQQTGNRIIVIDDESIEDGDYEWNDKGVSEMRCIVPGFIDVNFDVDTIAMFSGNLFQPDEDEFPLFMVSAIYPIPEFTEELDTGDDFEEGNDEEVYEENGEENKEEEVEGDSDDGTNEDLESTEQEIEINLSDLAGDEEL